ncbi:MAG: hypothetical protein GY759_24680 [Chloroflexi bacterium]|nr:hypothetical protein [Chloroflexota bacterium]
MLASPFILATLIYAIRDDKVLMLYRHKEPNLGQWIAPGGKIDANEQGPGIWAFYQIL